MFVGKCQEREHVFVTVNAPISAKSQFHAIKIDKHQQTPIIPTYFDYHRSFSSLFLANEIRKIRRK